MRPALTIVCLIGAVVLGETAAARVPGEVQAIGFDAVNALTPPPAWRVRNSACWGYDHDEP